MKKAIPIIICLSLLVPFLNAQDEGDYSNNEFKTLFGDRDVSHGGYGAMTFN